jgi:hypothetical protein
MDVDMNKAFDFGESLYSGLALNACKFRNRKEVIGVY